MKTHPSVEQLWQEYLKEYASDPSQPMPEAWYFGYNEPLANDLAALVLSGTKTATASLYKLYEHENEPLPQVGDLNIITDWEGIAQCIIKTTKVNVIPFKAVSEAFAKKEGEGDKSLKFWKKVHQDIFAQELAALGETFHEDILVVCEEFKVVLKNDHSFE